MNRTNLLFLVRNDGGDDKITARELGTRLMEQGHTVFLSDTDEDLECFGDVVDGYVEISPSGPGPCAVLYALEDRARPGRHALRERAVLPLPAEDDALSSFTSRLTMSMNGSAR